MMKLLLLLYQHETLIGIFIFGVAQMLADLLADMGWGWEAALVRGCGIACLMAILAVSVRQRKTILNIPLLFTEKEHREEARASLRSFVQQHHIAPVFRLIEKASPVYSDDLFIQMLSQEATPLRSDENPTHWEQVARQMLREWYP